MARGGRISDDAIREVRERASLVEVVSDAVTLRRRGRSVVGLCPFHAEKTPSFTVSEERGFYHCFGCGEHGDVFGFVMKTESLAFPEAVRRVAERFGVRLPEPVDGPARRGEPLAHANAVAAAFFRAELAGPNGARARAYLRGRGVSDESIARFGLGWAPGGDALARHLRAKGVPVEDALVAGLVVRRARPEGGNPVYDRFRERVMFPITDTTGKVIAFGGRILPDRAAGGDNPPPKYLNSPESPLFRKGHTVYGLAPARDAIRRAARVVVVEGYMDVIALAEAGVAEVVAPLGTALTADQLRVLRRFTDVVIACFDGDAAGRRAAARSFPVFLEAGLWGRGVFLPGGDDPDTFVRAHGRQAIEELLAEAVPLVDAYLEELGGTDRSAVGRRTEGAKEVARVLKRVRSPYEYDVLARLAAERLGVREEVLRAEGTAEPAPAGPALPLAGEAPHDFEELLVEHMASDPAVTRRVVEENIVEQFQHPAWRKAAGELIAGDEGARAELLQTLPKELRDRVVRRLLGEMPEENRQKAVADAIAGIRARRRRWSAARLQQEIAAAEARGDVERVKALVRERQEQLRKIESADRVRPEE